jgi:hypothetical protein
LHAPGIGAVFLAVRRKKAMRPEVVAAMKVAAHADRPGHRTGIECQHALDLVEQREGIEALAIDLVDEGDDRNVAQAADFEQFSGLAFDALGGIDHHDRRIDRGQRAIGILAEILVARRVEQIEGDALAHEGHHRTRDRDAALLDLHPVGLGAAPLAMRLDMTGQMDCAADSKSSFSGQRRLARTSAGQTGGGAVWASGCEMMAGTPGHRGSIRGGQGQGGVEGHRADLLVI